MRVYIVTYTLRLTWLRNYENLYSALRRFPHWMHYIDNTWFIASEWTAQEIYGYLAPYIFEDSKILITRFTREYFGLLPQEGWDWINARMLDSEL